ncbi:MAG TPA: glutathione S-transferase family protein [Rhizomicrobium sp.]|nr:glutathione S-transferase family protein [Rhizomicrobium sp.]
MTLKLYYHPLSSFCWKATIALYENGTPFEKVVVHLNEEASRAAFLEIWPIGQFPVLRDESRDWLVPESSIIVEYLDTHHPGRTRFVPDDPDLARQVRMRDRFFDLHVQVQMQKIMDDRWRADADKDRIGVERARARLTTALGMIEQAIGEEWVMGSEFTMADVAAAPALFYANVAMPFGSAYPRTARYLERLRNRPSFARTLEEAAPDLRSVFGIVP